MTTRHEVDGGWVLVEEDIDLRGRVAVYGIEDTPWRCVRLDRGWRAQMRPKGNQRRRYVGPSWESAPQTVRYLVKHGYLRPFTASQDPSIDPGT